MGIKLLRREPVSSAEVMMLSTKVMMLSTKVMMLSTKVPLVLRSQLTEQQ